MAHTPSGPRPRVEFSPQLGPAVPRADALRPRALSTTGQTAIRRAKPDKGAAAGTADANRVPQAGTARITRKASRLIRPPGDGLAASGWGRPEGGVFGQRGKPDTRPIPPSGWFFAKNPRADVFGELGGMPPHPRNVHPKTKRRRRQSRSGRSLREGNPRGRSSGWGKISRGVGFLASVRKGPVFQNLVVLKIGHRLPIPLFRRRGYPHPPSFKSLTNWRPFAKKPKDRLLGGRGGARNFPAN